MVINCVLATDIIDADLKKLRNARWEKAFQKKQPGEQVTKDDIDRKATIVIEHLIQASDVCHTMQHWHVYRKVTYPQLLVPAVASFQCIISNLLLSSRYVLNSGTRVSSAKCT